jgi:ABC-2 type transport system permease protein
VGYWAHALLGTASLLIVKHMLGLAWSPLQWALFPVALLGGALTMAGISLLPGTLSFWWGRAGSVGSFFRFSLREVPKYPLSIYQRWLRRPMFAVPYAFVNYLPGLYLLGRAQGPYTWLYPIYGVGMGALWLALFGLAWRAGLRRYNSAGG